jgi:hypothetical protein
MIMKQMKTISLFFIIIIATLSCKVGTHLQR